MTSCSLGDLSQISSHICGHSGTGINATGVGLQELESAIPALGESLERYCACIFTDSQFIMASANELGGEAVDLDSIPRCSAKELSHPKCPMVLPSKNVPIRWVKGLSLLDGRSVYLPAVMVYLFTGFSTPAERICFPITTGCAAHPSLERAILGGILEIVERDAISIVWLQQLQLPRIKVDCLPAPFSGYWERYQASSAGLESVFFDAMTDIGIPTVYGLQVCKNSAHATTLVSCSASMSYPDAVAKVIRDMSAIRVAFRTPKTIPSDWEEFNNITHGAAYMAHRDRSDAFDFLLRSPMTRPLSDLADLDGDNDRSALQFILDLMRRKGLDVYAVELSTDEALRANVRVVRVIIPGLQPVGFQYRARYLGHPRLFDAPQKMGYRAKAEAGLNVWPQPFC